MALVRPHSLIFIYLSSFLQVREGEEGDANGRPDHRPTRGTERPPAVDEGDAPLLLLLEDDGRDVAGQPG